MGARDVVSSALLLALAGSTLAGSRAAAQEPPAGDGPTVSRIVTLGGSVTETVFALGWGDRVVAVDQSSLFPPSVGLLPKVGYFRTLSAEGVLSLEPNLVLASSASGPPIVLDQLRAAGVEVARVEDAETPDEIPDKVRAVARVLGDPDAGEQLAAEVERELADARGLAAHVGELPSAIFVWGRGTSGLSVAGRDTGADVMLREAGIDNAAGGIAGYQPMNAEALLLADPAVLIVPRSTAERLGGVEALLAMPGIRATRAGRAGRVVTVDLLAFIGFGPRTGEALRQLIVDVSRVSMGVLPTVPVRWGAVHPGRSGPGAAR